MATKLIRLGHSLQLYTNRNLKSWSYCLRHFSNQNRKTSECAGQSPKPAKVKKTEPEIKWLNIRAGIFGPDDERLPLPGDIGVQNLLNKNFQAQSALQFQEFTELRQKVSELLVTNQESRLEDVHQVQLRYNELNSSQPPMAESCEAVLECKVQKCPKLLLKDFQSLFPSVDLSKDVVRVVTFCQKTENDMSRWNEAVETEREELTEHFIDCTERICSSLRSKGFWADFVDPESGRPFSGAFTNATFFETDERYRHLGFKIDDLGCCKVISHRVWGSKIFVGAMFTTAPIDEIEEALHPIDASMIL